MEAGTKKMIVLAVIATGLTAIGVYFKKQFALLKDSCTIIAGGVIHEISFNKIFFTLILKIRNKSDVTVIARKINLNVYVNNLLVSRITQNENQKIISKAYSNFNVNIDFNPKDLLKAGLKNIETILTETDTLAIRVEGTMSIETGILMVNSIPIQEKFTLKELLSSDKKTKC
jgi:LEA14-like dessication related protein